MAGTTAMHYWWHMLTDTDREDWCELITADTDVTETMAHSVDESYLGAADLSDSSPPMWREAWDEFWMVNTVARTEPWVLNPAFQVFLEERCDL